jgi:hypothetical protein
VKRIFIILLAVVLAIGMLLPAAGVMAGGGCLGPLVSPRFIAGNPTAADAGYGDCVWVKFNPDGTMGGSSATYDSDTYIVDWTIYDAGKQLGYENASPGITAIIVKGGPDANVYDYDPAAITDCGLVSPTMANGNIPAISHVIFIWCDDGGGGGPGEIQEVGGEIYPINKVAILTPAIVLAIALLSGAGIFIRRRQTQR